MPPDQSDNAQIVLSQFGEMRPSDNGSLGVGLQAGAEAMADVIRRLDAEGIRVQHVELNEPSLDDVFAEATGHRLEGAAAAPAESAAPPPEQARRGRRGARSGR